MDEDAVADTTVLVVDDERQLADLYADFLADRYEVRVACGGEAAIESLTSDLDVVLLDRRMPSVSGNEVLARIEELALDVRIAMVTAINPDFDIIDLGIDDYLVKPVTRDEVRETVDRLVALEEYDARARELSAKKVKRNVLAVEKSREELRTSEGYRRLTEEIATLEDQLDEIAERIDPPNLRRYT